MTAHLLLALLVLVVSGAGAFAWWRFRRVVEHFAETVVELLRQILDELRRGTD